MILCKEKLLFWMWLIVGGGSEYNALFHLNTMTEVPVA